jgi:predicted transcriptional regulator of viral defense system
MTTDARLEAFIENADGIIHTRQLSAAGFHRNVLGRLVQDGELVRLSRGVYLKPAAWEDEFFLLQNRFGKGIFSHETALYLHGFSDRTPARFTMTFPWGYNAASLKKENIIVKRVVKGNYGIGIAEMPSPAKNIIRVYDVERTLCDVVRGNNTCDIHIVNQAMKRYAASKGKDIQKLMEYAGQLRVKQKILNYMEVLL